MHEALDILRSEGLCSNLSLAVVTYSKSKKSVSACQAELSKCQTSQPKGHGSKSFTAVYICPPYSLLIFKLENGNFMFIDPHPLMHEYGG